MTREEAWKHIRDGRGFGLTLDGWWYRTDDEFEDEQVVLRSGPEMMPPTGAIEYEYEERETLLNDMEAILPLDQWQFFEDWIEET